ncbi:hypothetical protein EDF56_104253 [Novosphingobium sp. PhB165]|uniref:DUF2946 family protein n=1 Tax=Novosphingobium sp. PhB165 TaxID=2485105 RepID=UPI00104F2829|nr:DUF2946 family protein [Novosphingobium sp. PhB165]TCM18721.1 hypothetical protein EDF56_104253 [Novosphingobium sp. PhB165]
MGTLRHFFRARPGLAALLLAVALCLKAVVPAGYMPAAQGGPLMVELCSGAASTGGKVMVALARKGGAGNDAGKAMDHPCAFSSHAAAAIDAALPVLLAAALAFVFVAAILRAPLALPALRTGLRPPLRGPPATI